MSLGRGFGPSQVGTDVPRATARDALARSDFHPGDPLVEVRETQTSLVFLAGDRAYKVNKPVHTEFLDLSTLEQRRLACLEELRVNRELAPAVGLRVCALVAESDSFVLADADADGAVEYALEMRRVDDARTMASLARRGLLVDEQVAAVARRLAAFHAAAPSCQVRDRVSAVMRASQRNVRELLDIAGADAARSAQASARFTDEFLLAHGHEIAARADAGFVRDAHGDLRAEHVILDERLAILGRPAFDPRVREIDVAEDLAFLVMDLERIGDRRAADKLVQGYWEAGGELCSPELLAFYGAQRALVRAKVELLGAQQLDGDAATPAHERAAELLRQAERLAWRARGPMVLAISGPTAGSGEPALAAELARRSGFELLSAATAPRSAYAPGECAKTYRRLGERAREVVVDGYAVIVDGTFRHIRQRAEFLEGLRDSRALHSFEYHLAPAATPAAGATYHAWDGLRGMTILTVCPAAGVEHVVDQIADWLDARQCEVCPPE
jgi:aminoglycoside phosphotransferase family enzyme